MIGLGLRLRALGRPGHWGTCSFPKKNTLGQSGSRAHGKCSFPKNILGHSGTRALALFQKKRKTPLGSWALGQMLVSKKQSWALGHSGTQALIKKLSKDYQKDYPKTIKKIICNDLYLR